MCPFFGGGISCHLWWMLTSVAHLSLSPIIRLRREQFRQQFTRLIKHEQAHIRAKKRVVRKRGKLCRKVGGNIECLFRLWFLYSRDETTGVEWQLTNTIFHQLSGSYVTWKCGNLFYIFALRAVLYNIWDGMSFQTNSIGKRNALRIQMGILLSSLWNRFLLSLKVVDRFFFYQIATRKFLNY